MKRLLSVTACLTLAMAGAASAAPVFWTQWNEGATTSATAGAATGAAGGLGVSYSGELENLFFGYPSWGPSSTFSGGSVDNAPPSAGGIIRLLGGNSNVTNTITFSHAVIDPVVAIWSLGQGGNTARFDFDHSFTIEAGGPGAEYGGGSITSSGNSVLGTEGDGVVKFHGTFTSLSFTNPVREDWYGFTVGISGISSGAPEPAAWALLMLGFGGAGAALRRRRSALIA